MFKNSALGLFISFILVVSSSVHRPAYSQDDSAQKTFSTEELDQMLAPVALYPDEVLANVLMAATYPLDIVQAARWRKEPANKSLKGDALTKALEAKAWDPSIKALTLFPEVLQNMSEQLEWTQSLGDAFLAQEADVFARVQFLRQKADAAGNLKTNKEQKVTKQTNPDTRTDYIVIQPASPQYVYVPVYQPTVVYGPWWYPTYPPYYWNWYPGASFVNGMFWGAGFAVANNIWGWNSFNWRNGNIDIDINRYNTINVNRPQITNNRWEHNAAHRGPVPYRDKATREKFAKDKRPRDINKDFGGFDKDKTNKGTLDKSRDIDSVKNKLGEGSAEKYKDKIGDRGGDKLKDKSADRDISKAKDKVGDRDLSKAKDRVGDRDVSKVKDKVGDRGGDRVKSASRDIKKPATKALDVQPKAQVKKHVDRGGASRAAAKSHPRARAGGGGGRARAGGGGGRRR